MDGGLVRQVEELLVQVPGRVAFSLEIGDWYFGFGDNDVFPAASLIKVPVLLAALQGAAEGEVDLGREVLLPGTSVGGGGLVEFFRPHTSLALRDLLLCMIAISDNAATNLALDTIGFERVNRFLDSLGLTHTTLRRRMMDFAAREAGLDNTTTAAEMHRIFREIARPATLDARVAEEARTFLERQLFREGLGYFLPEGAFIHKTGELDDVFNDAGVLHPHGTTPVVMTFLATGIPSVAETQVLAARLGRLVRDAIEKG